MRQKRINVGLPAEIHAMLKKIAKANGRTIISQICVWVKLTAAEKVLNSHDTLFHIAK